MTFSSWTSSFLTSDSLGFVPILCVPVIPIIAFFMSLASLIKLHEEDTRLDVLTQVFSMLATQ